MTILRSVLVSISITVAIASAQADGPSALPGAGAGGHARVVLLPPEAMPEPGGWMTLLCAVLVMACIARRRAGAGLN